MATCARCHSANPAGARFCNGCGAPLRAAAPADATRTTVTALFCDVVGSTPLGEQLDPEVLRRVLQQYFEEMRDVVEAHGGEVSKFIGDAVVGVFGAAQVHEDDPVRAVRAAAEMRARLGTLNASLRRTWGIELASRTGVCTGEVVVAAGDEVVLGDVMNTAARLQQAADAGEILIADVTAGLVRDAVSAEPVDLDMKGKAAPVRAWRLGAVDRDAAGHRRSFDQPLVGRAAELRALEGLLDVALAERQLRLATVVGEAGIGKSRLVTEFEHGLERRGLAVTRRHGRCPAYGDGIGFWPLAEIVRRHLELEDTDDEEVARTRLAAAVDGMDDAPWLRARLAPLVGLPAEAAERDEVFTAWQRFFDQVAARAPLLLLFEDLHWADAAVLAFIRHLAEWSSGVPILTVCTARPTLFDAHPDWADLPANATTLALSPLSRGATTELVQALLADVSPAPDTVTTVVDRAAGNPLYAHEYVRLLADRGGSVAPDEAMPETVRAVIAARLDELAVESRSLLRDAAVCGKVFWALALAAIGGRDAEQVRASLHELARKQLIRRAPASTLPGDEEYAFSHDLVHEVVYNQIPLFDRSDKHRRTAEWIEQAAGERIGDRAELLAHHYGEALSLARATSQEDPEPLRRPALRYATIAATRAMALDTEHALRLARQGLALSLEGDPERARLLCVLGTARSYAGAFDEARELLRSARVAAEQADDAESLAGAYLQEALIVYISGDGQLWGEVCDDALARLAGGRPTGSLALLLNHAAVRWLFRHEMDAAAALIDEGLEMSRALDDQVAETFALMIRGLLRSETSDRRALDDYEASVALAVEIGSPWLAMTRFHLGLGRLVWYGPAAAEAPMREGIDDAVRIRNPSYETFARMVDVVRLGDGDDWDELLRAAARTLEWANANHALQYRTRAAAPLARVLALRGELAQARAAMDGILEQARRIIDGQALIPALASAALIECLDGNAAAARALGLEIAPGWLHGTAPIGDVLRVLVACDGVAHAHALVERLDDGPPRVMHSAVSGRALLAEAAGDHGVALELYDDAATRWRTLDNPYEHARALAGRARCLRSLGRGDEAATAAEGATGIFERLGVVRPELLAPASSGAPA